jgi:hypothetical protein
VSASSNTDSRLESAIAEVYRGPLEDFVRRRDALAKELRSAGDRESASTLKALRKPSRIAWALNLAALDGQNAVDPLVAAVAATLDAQAGGGDVRAAIVGLRGAVREFANQAAIAAQQSGHRIEPAVLANAVLAVLGRQESFDQLRAGSLAAIPEGGGLDFLAALPTPSDAAPAPVPAKASAPAARRSASAERAGVEAAARAAARQAAGVLAEARVRSEAARRALRDAESRLHAAEARLRRAEEEERAARTEHDRTRQEAEAAAGRVLEAETAVADAERRIASTPGASA